jgi:predicted ATPase
MEQPELHLHPAYQARLADVFAGAIRSNKDNRSTLRFLVETHSESLINRLGELISEGFISPEDIAIYVFEKDYDDEVTRIRPVSFEKDGTLSNWPIGFFSAGPTL